MQWAILIVAALGTTGTILALGLDQWQKRRRLDLEFQGAWSNSDTQMIFTLRVSNGPAPISRVDLHPFIAAPGFTFNSQDALPPLRLDPWEHQDVGIPFKKPRPVDLPPGLKPVFSAPVGVVAFFGHKKLVVMHPDAPLADPKLLRNLKRGKLRPVAGHKAHTGSQQ